MRKDKDQSKEAEAKEAEQKEKAKLLDIIDEDVQFWLIFSFCLVALIYSVVMVFVQKIDGKYEKTSQNPDIRTTESVLANQNYISGTDPPIVKLEKIQSRCQEAILHLYIQQSLFMIFLGLLLICFTAYWFTPDSQTALSCIISFIIGCLVVAANTFVCLKLSVYGDGKILVQADTKMNQDNYSSQTGKIIGYSFLVSSVIATFGLSLLFLTLSCVFYANHNLWNRDGETGEYLPLTAKMYQNLVHSVLGFGVGICFAALYYREAAGQSARGILVGEELCGKSDLSNIQIATDCNIGMASIISDTYAVNVVQLMDSLSLLGSLICVFLILSSQSSTMTTVKKEEAALKGGFYASLFLFSISIFLNFALALITGGSCEENKISSQTSQRLMLQILISNTVMFLVFLILPRYVLPRKFTIGKEGDLFYSKEMMHGDFIWCLVCGLILQAFLLFYGEYCTSHFYGPVRDIAQNISKSVSKGIIASQIWANFNQYFIILVFSLFLLISFCIAGFYGIALCAMGLLCSPIALLTANFLAGIGHDSHKLAQLIHEYGPAVERLYALSWATRNFSIFLQIVNCGGVFMVDFVCIGCLLIFTKITQFYIWSGFTLFGVLYGSSLAYFFRALSSYAVKSVGDEVFNEYDYNQERDNEQSKKEVNIHQEQKFVAFISQNFNIGIQKVTLNIIVSILSIIILGGLFGGECIIGFVIGLNIVGLHMTVLQMLIGNSLKAARHYSESIEDQKGSSNTILSKQGYIYALTMESVPGSTMLSYLLFNTMFVLLGSVAFAHSGRLKEWIEQWVVYVPENSTKWIDVSQTAVESGYEKAIDYITGEDMIPSPIVYDDYPKIQQATADGEGAAEAAAKFFLI